MTTYNSLSESHQTWKGAQYRECFTIKLRVLQGMWVLFGLFYMFSNFYRLHFHNETFVALANLQQCFSQNWTSPNSVAVIGSACLFDSLTKYTGPPNCIEVFVFGTSPKHTPIKYRCPIKKTNWITTPYRRWYNKYLMNPSRPCTQALCHHTSSEVSLLTWWGPMSKQLSMEEPLLDHFYNHEIRKHLELCWIALINLLGISLCLMALVLECYAV